MTREELDEQERLKAKWEAQERNKTTPRVDELLVGREHGNAIEHLARDLERELNAAIEQRDKYLEEAAMWRKHIKTCLQYPRGSEAQVRCLEEVGGDAAYMDEKHRKGNS